MPAHNMMSLWKKERATLTVLVGISPWQLKGDLGVFCNMQQYIILHVI